MIEQQIKLAIGFNTEEGNYPFGLEANAKRSINNQQGSIALHESANYLIAKKSKLYASSKGIGQGATFTMLLLVQGEEWQLVLDRTVFTDFYLNMSFSYRSDKLRQWI